MFRFGTEILRGLVKSPGLSATLVITLALGIGANTAIFSLFHQVLLAPLPVSEPHQLVNFSAPGPKQGNTACTSIGSCNEIVSYPLFQDLEREQTVFTGLVGHTSFFSNVAFADHTTTAYGAMVSGNYFSVLGLQPALGRLLGPTDAPGPGESRVAVISHAFWQRELGADPDVIGELLTVNGETLTIVGITPRGFSGTIFGQSVEVFVPLTMRWLLEPTRNQNPENRLDHWVYLFARLKPGISIEQAQEAINVPYRAILHDIEAPLQGTDEDTLARFKARELILAPGARGQSVAPGQARPALVALLGVAALLLLIACANVANLMLARATSRSGDIAVHMALGAGRPRLVIGQLGEALVLALLGGLAGLLVAFGALRLIIALMPPDLSGMLSSGLHPSMLGFALLLTLAAVLLFGLYPALKATAVDPATVLHDEAGRGAGSRAGTRLRAGLVTVQIALSLALLITAGLFTHSLFKLGRTDLGMETSSLITFRVSPERNGYTPERSAALFENLEEELAALPGVEGVAVSMVPLLVGWNWGGNITVEGFEAGPGDSTHINYNAVNPGYFHVLGIPLITGRDFERADGADAAPVVIVNESFVRKFNLDSDAVGKRMAQGQGDNIDLDMEIVGVVADAAYSDIKDQPPAQAFRPRKQYRGPGVSTFYLRTTMSPGALFPSIRETVAHLDPNLPLEDLDTLPGVIRNQTMVDRLTGTLSATFAALATLLAAIGLYGVMAYTVARRTREIGLRSAVGAKPAQLERMVLTQVARMTAAGTVAGLACAALIGHWAQSLLFELGAFQPGIAAAAVAVLVLVALGAAWLPARRAAMVQPIEALRHE